MTKIASQCYHKEHHQSLANIKDWLIFLHNLPQLSRGSLLLCTIKYASHYYRDRDLFSPIDVYIFFTGLSFRVRGSFHPLPLGMNSICLSKICHRYMIFKKYLCVCTHAHTCCDMYVSMETRQGIHIPTLGVQTAVSYLIWAL